MVKVKKNLIGQKFGKLTVIEQAEDYVSPKGQHKAQWSCECDCREHNRVIVVQESLINNAISSCGCLKKNNSNMVKAKEDLTGRQFGMLTVIKQVEDYIKPNGEHHSMWLCKCSCNYDSKVVVSGSNLKSGHTKSCGCANPIKAKMKTKTNNKYDVTSNSFGILWSINTDEKVYFDIEDSNNILQHSWKIDSNGYPYTTINGKSIRMHVFLNRPWHDHHNRNKKDNRKDNLIPCTNKENVRNSSIKKNNKSGYIGVYLNKKNKKWVAQITIDGKTKKIGDFCNKKDAVYARLIKEKEHFGEFAPQRHLFEEFNVNTGGLVD